jgi:hypothetical protein
MKLAAVPCDERGSTAGVCEVEQGSKVEARNLAFEV